MFHGEKVLGSPQLLVRVKACMLFKQMQQVCGTLIHITTPSKKHPSHVVRRSCQWIQQDGCSVSTRNECIITGRRKSSSTCPRMENTTSAAHAQALFSLVQKSCLGSPAWHTICKDIEVLANTMQLAIGYSDHLEAANKKQQRRQAQQEPVWQLSDHVTVSCCESKPMVQLIAHEKMLNDFMTGQEAYSPVMCDEQNPG